MSSELSLRPVSGAVDDVVRLLGDWLGAADPPPLSVRTSGTTGRPKDVLLSRDAVVTSATATLTRLGGPGDWILALPIHYVAGLQVAVRALLAGHRPYPIAADGSVAATRAALSPSDRSYVSLVPTQLHRLLGDPAEADALAGLDAVLLGGAAASDALLGEAGRRGVLVVTTYGMSETCGGCVYDGVPLDGVRVRIGARDRVELSGPVLFDGYEGDPAGTAEVLDAGWLRSPDAGRLLDDGRLELLGRLDDVVVSGGVNVPLGAVERLLHELPGLERAAVVGLPDAEWGTRVVVAVGATSATRAALPGLDEIRNHVSATCPRAWAPREVVVLDDLPMLSSGKVDRQLLGRRLAAQRPSAARHG